MKTAAVPTILVGALLLTGCAEKPDNLEVFFDWRQKFFLHVDQQTVEPWVGPVLRLAVAVALVLCLLVLIHNLKSERPIWGYNFITGLSIFVAIALVYFYIPAATAFGEAIMPPELTLDRVFSALRLGLDGGLADLLVGGWAITFTLVLPLFSAFWEIMMLLGAVVALIATTLARSMKGIVYIVTQVYGWGSFLVLYNTLISLIDRYYPTWDYMPVKIFVTAFYVMVSVTLLLFCYIGIPFFAISLVPRSDDEYKSSGKKREERIRDSKVDWGTIFAPIPIPNDSPDDEPDQDRYHSNDNYDDEDPSDGSINPQLPRGPSGGGLGEVIEAHKGDIPPTKVSRSETSETSNGDEPDPNKILLSKSSRLGSNIEHKDSRVSEEVVDSVENFPSSKVKQLKSLESGSRSAETSRPNRNNGDSNRLEIDVKKDKLKKDKAHVEFLDKTGKVLEVVGVVTASPKVVIFGKGVELAADVLDRATEEGADTKKVLDHSAKEVAKRVLRNKYPDLVEFAVGKDDRDENKLNMEGG